MIQVADLRKITAFADLPKEELSWFAENCSEHKFKLGEHCYIQGEEVNHLICLIEGTFNLVRYAEGKEISNWLLEAGSVSGLLPFSRMKVHAATTYALSSCHVAEFPSRLFPALQANAPSLLNQLVLLMIDRSRRFTRENVEMEKLASLGTLAAGLAHELNNPASAIKRAAQNLRSSLSAFNQNSEALFAKDFSEDQKSLLKIILERDSSALTPPSSLERSDREDQLADWLEALNLDNPWEMAATFVTGGIKADELEVLIGTARESEKKVFLAWIYRDIEMRILSQELLEGSSRISELVTAMKQYSFMDRSQEKKDVPLHAGLENTLVILKHKLNAKALKVDKRYGDLTDIPAYGSELNQVWTNLLDNAIDALAEGGKIIIETKRENAAKVAIINIIDDGPGIPTDIQSRIFEPFFTTKGVGQGTGMGLDIVSRIVKERHLGTIQLKSEPGFTCFSVRLPLD